MSDEFLEKGTQTIILVTPHLLTQSEENILRVRCTQDIQTETHIDPSKLTSEEIKEIFAYIPISDILRDALYVLDLPKKNVIAFNDTVMEESIAHMDEKPSSLSNDPHQMSSGQVKSSLKAPKMAEVKDTGVQTHLMVRPMVLDLKGVAQVFCNIQVQTSSTFSPNASMGTVTNQLNKYHEHQPGSFDLLSNTDNRQNDKQSDPPEIEESVLTDSSVSVDSTAEVVTDPLENPTEDKNIKEIEPAVKQLAESDIEEICAGCCTEEEVLNKIKDWFNVVKQSVDEETKDEPQDDILGKPVESIEAEIMASMDNTVETLESQLERMQNTYNPPEVKEEEVQNTELFAGHIEQGACIGKFRDKTCTCDCHLLEGVPGADYPYNICGPIPLEPNLRSGASSSPALITCQCKPQTSSDLPNDAATPRPLNARACTNRKCNCLLSEGCLHCEQALRIQEKMENLNPARLKSCKQFHTSQNIEFLTCLDGEYADAYLEQLDNDNAYTQTDATDFFFGTAEAARIPPPPCSCLTSVEIPWDMILVPPTPKKREGLMEALPEAMRAQLKELAVKPMTNEELLALTKEFLDDNIGNAENIDEIQKQILAEKAKLDAAAAEEDDEEAPPEEENTYKPCRPRAAIKPFQVFDPECEVYNEPYMDRMYKYICDNEDGSLEECTSRIEMPWHHIVLPKSIKIRKGRNPCERIKPAALKDPHRKCGPEYRANIKRQQELFGSDSGRIISCKPNPCNVRISVPDLKSSKISCLCAPTKSTSQPEIALHKGVSDTCVCAKGKDKDKEIAKQPPIKFCQFKKLESCDKPCTSLGVATDGVSPGGSKTSRTERIAALLESCKKEMEPIKDGINQLRARIKELNLPDMIAYQEPPQRPGASSPGLNMMGSMNSPMLGPDMYGMPQMPMCYPPPMMCYPFPPCMFPPPTSPTSHAPMMSSGIGSSRQPTSGKHGYNKSKSKHSKKPCSYTTTESESGSTDYDNRRHHKRAKSPTSSSSKIICACKGQSSKNIIPCESKTSGADVSPPSTPSTVPKKNAPSESSLCVCIKCPVGTGKKPKASKIPRLISSTASSKKSGMVCPCSSLISQNPNTDSQNSGELTNSGTEVTLVNSCATQMEKPPCDVCEPIKKGNITEDSASNCKIRFSEECKTKCTKCTSAKYMPQKISCGTVVRNGKPVDEDE